MIEIIIVVLALLSIIVAGIIAYFIATSNTGKTAITGINNKTGTNNTGTNRVPVEEPKKIETLKCDSGFTVHNNSCKCDINYFKSGYECLRCPENSYSSIVDSNSCICLEGYTMDKNNCLCSTGTYLDSKTNLCLKCPENMTSRPGEKCVCKDGFTMIGDKCTNNSGLGEDTVCAIGYFLDETNKNICTKCPDNSSNVVTNSYRCVCNNGFLGTPHSASGCYCSDDSYINKTIGSCTKCSKYSKVNPTDKYSCSCFPGFIDTKGVCECPLGSFINEKNECVKCPNGLINSSINSTGCYCNDNYYLKNGVCTQCPIHHTSYTNSTGCVCSYGYSSSDLSVADQTNVTCTCPTGSYSFNDVCYKCPSGSNSYGVNNTACICDEVGWTGWTFKDQACTCDPLQNKYINYYSHHCEICPTGTNPILGQNTGCTCDILRDYSVNENGECGCRNNYYIDKENNDRCTQCGEYNHSTSSINATGCVCDEGYVKNNITKNCYCPDGYYIDTSDNNKCKVVPNYSSSYNYKDTINKINATDFICNVNRVKTMNNCNCPVDYYVDTDNSCKACPLHGTTNNNINVPKSQWTCKDGYNRGDTISGSSSCICNIFNTFIDTDGLCKQCGNYTTTTSINSTSCNCLSGFIRATNSLCYCPSGKYITTRTVYRGSDVGPLIETVCTDPPLHATASGINATTFNCDNNYVKNTNTNTCDLSI